jgi:hypothetical protein
MQGDGFGFGTWTSSEIRDRCSASASIRIRPAFYAFQFSLVLAFRSHRSRPLALLTRPSRVVFPFRDSGLP